MPTPSPEQLACTALWSATLSLMAAYMEQPAPAHRLLLSRRIAANFQLLARQDCFSAASRSSFTRLQQHWAETAARLARPTAPAGGRGLLRSLRRIGSQRL